VHLQSVEFDVWFGVGALALLWACIQIWFTGRALGRVQQDLGTHPGGSITASATELSGSAVQ